MAALRIKERDDYLQYSLAGGDPKKWEWIYNLEQYVVDSVTPQEVQNMIMQHVGKKYKATQGNKEEFFSKRKLPVVKMLADGTYIDDKGKPVQLPNDALYVPMDIINKMNRHNTEQS